MILNKLPYLKKDILWALAISAFFLLAGSPILNFSLVSNVIFIIFAFIVWRKKAPFNNKGNFILSAGRVFSLNAFIVILFYLIYPLFANPQFSIDLLFDRVRLLLLLGAITYGLQYYIFTLWKKKYDFNTQKKLIVIELVGLTFLQFIA